MLGYFGAPPVRDLAGREDDEHSSSSEPQVRRPETGQAPLRGITTFERINEEAQLAQLRNTGQKVIGNEADV